MRRILVLGLISEVVYFLALARPLTLLGRFPGVRTDLTGVIGLSPWTFVWYVATFGVLFALYLWAYLVCRRVSGQAVLPVLFFSTAFAGTLMFTYPVASRDLFGYLQEARLYWAHDLNPLVIPRGAIPSDPVRYYIDWPHLTSSYGPAWALLSGLPLHLAQGHHLSMTDQQLLRTLLAFKGLAVLFYLGTIVAIYLTASHLQPRLATAASLLYGWNPLVLYEVVANGHNDVAMAFFAVLALYGAVTRRWWIAFPALALTVLVKYVGGLVALPLLLYALLVAWRGDWRERGHIALGALLGLATAIAVVAPFWVGPRTFTVFLTFTDYYIFSPYEIALRVLLRFRVPLSTAKQILQPLALAAFVLVFLASLTFLRTQPRRLIQVGALGIAAYLILAAFWFQPWYVSWLLTVAVLLPYSRFATLALLFSFGALMLDAVWLIAWRLNWYGGHLTIGRAVTVLFVFGPVLAYLLWWGGTTVWPYVRAGFAYWWQRQWWAGGRPSLETQSALVSRRILEVVSEE